jgi:hypothetical protein
MALGAVGCASGTVTLSNAKIDQASRAVDQAKQNTAPLYAPAELKLAEDKLAQARSAVAAQNNYDGAIRWAEQAQADADYARVKASSEKTRKTAEEMQQNIQALRKELERLSQ